MDFEAIYPSTPDNLAMPAVREYLDSRTTMRPSTEMTMRLLDTVKSSNYFEFGEQLFEQTGGVSIGKKHGPAFCCLAAGKLEEDIIYPSERFKLKVMDDKFSPDENQRFWKCLIDDIIAPIRCEL